MSVRAPTATHRLPLRPLPSGPPASDRLAPVDRVDAVRASRAPASARVRPPPPAVVESSFPLTVLERIDGRGRVGQLFRLDGGSLCGMSLICRRIRVNGRPGLELLCRVDDAELRRLEQRLLRAGARRQPLGFSAATLGPDGVMEQAEGRRVLRALGRRAPSCLHLTDRRGAAIELAGTEAPRATRGRVRIRTLGADRDASSALAALARRLGLGHWLAPPTPAAARRLRAMRALWQRDPEAARQLSDRRERLDPAEVERALRRVGVDGDRIAGLTEAEVAPGHFTVVDPVQAVELAEAGACYLYASVETPEAVLAMLRDGLRSTLRRFSEGLLIEGLSPDDDFHSGGASGVFTRLVTREAILGRRAWTGGAFQIVLGAELLARTDWYGWDDDRFGCSSGLDAENFGLGLLDAIGRGPRGFSDYNELIFREAIGPDWVRHVVAPDEGARLRLIAALQRAGTEPPDGRPWDQVVVVSRQLGPWSAVPPPPPADMADGGALRWFLLTASDDAPERAALEARLLDEAGDAEDGVGLATWLEAAARRGHFAADPARVGARIEAELGAGPHRRAAVLEGVAEAWPCLLAADSDAIARALRRALAVGADVSPEAWSSGLARLLGAGARRGASLTLALRAAGQTLCDARPPELLEALRRGPPWTTDPVGFAREGAEALARGVTPVELRLFALAARRPPDLGGLPARLLELETPAAARLLDDVLAGGYGLGLSPVAVASVASERGRGGPVARSLLAAAERALLLAGDPTTARRLAGTFGRRATPRTVECWAAALDALTRPASERSSRRAQR